jgi:hypothetical protein
MFPPAYLQSIANQIRFDPTLAATIAATNPALAQAVFAQHPELGQFAAAYNGRRAHSSHLGEWGDGSSAPAAAGFPQAVAGPNGGPLPSGGAKMMMYRTDDLGPPWLRIPIFPTAPFVPNREDVARQVRYYSGGLNSSDSDYTVGSEASRTVQFDLPVKIVAVNASSFVAGGFPAGHGPRDVFQLKYIYNQGDQLSTTARIASTVAGTSEAPGEIGAEGWTVQAGGALILGITPLMAGLRIDVTFHAIEMRGATNIRG